LLGSGAGLLGTASALVTSVFDAALCARPLRLQHLRGDINLSWPTGQIAVMGSAGAVGILFRCATLFSCTAPLCTVTGPGTLQPSLPAVPPFESPRASTHLKSGRRLPLLQGRG
jgi:hypothetical protein